MKTFTANDLHEKRTEVYQAAVKGPVKITHKHHGDFVLSHASEIVEAVTISHSQIESFTNISTTKPPRHIPDIDIKKGGVIKGGESYIIGECGGPEIQLAKPIRADRELSKMRVILDKELDK